MSKQSLYDVYKRPNGLLYRAPLDSPLHKRAEFYAEHLQRWIPSGHALWLGWCNKVQEYSFSVLIFSDRDAAQDCPLDTRPPTL